MKEILVLGGGASGLAAAIAAAQAGGSRVRVTLLEQNPAPGKKLLATGNGRCNFDNLASGEPERYFTAAPQALASLLAAIDAAGLPAWWEGLGLVHRADETGRLYPYSNQASDLTGLLVGWLDALGVSVHTGCRVMGMGQKGRGYAVQVEQEDRRTLLVADKVICALGGSAGPQFGTGGFGPAMARRAGGRVEPLYPCLTPLRCKETEQLKPLAGLRARGAVTLWEGGSALAREEGEIQFTDYGLSGICVMQLSGLLAPGRGPQEPAGTLPPCWNSGQSGWPHSPAAGRGCWTAAWGTPSGLRRAFPAANPPSWGRRTGADWPIPARRGASAASASAAGSRPRPPAAASRWKKWNQTSSSRAAGGCILWAKRWTVPAAAAASTSTGPLARAWWPGAQPPPPAER